MKVTGDDKHIFPSMYTQPDKFCFSKAAYNEQNGWKGNQVSTDNSAAPCLPMALWIKENFGRFY